MLKSRYLLILGSFGIFLISIVLTVPANQAYKWGLLPSNVSFQGLSGRLLDGCVQYANIKKTTLNNVSWSWQPLSLLSGQFLLNWAIDGQELAGKGQASSSFLGNKQISNTALTFKAEKLNPYLPKGNTLTGSVALDISSATFSQQLDSIAATAAIESLLVTTTIGEFQIGATHLVAKGTEAEGFQLQVTDAQDSDRVNIIADVNQQQLTLSGQVQADSNLAKQTTPLLPLIAKKQGNTWVLSWQGTLPEKMILK